MVKDLAKLSDTGDVGSYYVSDNSINIKNITFYLINSLKRLL